MRRLWQCSLLDSAATMLQYQPFFSASNPFHHPPCHNHHPKHCMCNCCISLSNFRTMGISITPCTCSITQLKTYVILILPHAPSHLASPRHNTCGSCILPSNVFHFHFHFHVALMLQQLTPHLIPPHMRNTILQ